MSDQTILSASGFVNSIGVNSHAGFGWIDYNNLAKVNRGIAAGVLAVANAAEAPKWSNAAGAKPYRDAAR